VATLAAGLGSAGIITLCVFDGAINGGHFRAYLDQVLAAMLWPDDIVLLDNLASHKVDVPAHESRLKTSRQCRYVHHSAPGWQTRLVVARRPCLSCKSAA
jgi:hypothetical protein